MTVGLVAVDAADGQLPGASGRVEHVRPAYHAAGTGETGPRRRDRDAGRDQAGLEHGRYPLDFRPKSDDLTAGTTPHGRGEWRVEGEGDGAHRSWRATRGRRDDRFGGPPPGAGTQRRIHSGSGRAPAASGDAARFNMCPMSIRTSCFTSSMFFVMPACAFSFSERRRSSESLTDFVTSVEIFSERSTARLSTTYRSPASEWKPPGHRDGPLRPLSSCCCSARTSRPRRSPLAFSSERRLPAEGQGRRPGANSVSAVLVRRRRPPRSCADLREGRSARSARSAQGGSGRGARCSPPREVNCCLPRGQRPPGRARGRRPV